MTRAAAMKGVSSIRVNAAHTISSAASTPPRRGWPRDDDTAIVIRMNEAGTIAPMRETDRRGPACGGRVHGGRSRGVARLRVLRGAADGGGVRLRFRSLARRAPLAMLGRRRGVPRATFGALASPDHGPAHGLWLSARPHSTR